MCHTMKSQSKKKTIASLCSVAIICKQDPNSYPAKCGKIHLKFDRSRYAWERSVCPFKGSTISKDKWSFQKDVGLMTLPYIVSQLCRIIGPGRCGKEVSALFSV